MAGAFLAEVGQVVAAVAWVAFYSYAVNPGQPVETYQAHAQLSGPWVSILAGAPIFYAASRWVAGSKRAARALYVIFLVMDLALLVLLTNGVTTGEVTAFTISYLTKAVACDLGGRTADSRKEFLLTMTRSG